MALFQLSWVMG